MGKRCHLHAQSGILFNGDWVGKSTLRDKCDGRWRHGRQHFDGAGQQRGGSVDYIGALPFGAGGITVVMPAVVNRRVIPETEGQLD